MSISAPPLPGHRAHFPAGRPTAPALSRSTWRHVRQTLTAGLFTVATVAGVIVGLQGANVSPVAPTAPIAAVAAVAAPTIGDVHGALPAHRQHR